MKLIYGSQAIKHWFPDFKREPKDLDIITDDISFVNTSTKRVEYYYVTEFFDNFNNKDPKYLDLNYLYTFKISHAAWDINWEKHMMDIEFLKSKGCKIDEKLFNILYKKWEIIHGKKKVKMNVKNEDFFKENIKRRYDHEWLHEQFKFDERPMNEKIRKDLSSPICSEELWNNLSYPEQIKTALEEIFVLASERYIFVDKPMPYKTARIKTLKQMITSSTSGWFNKFLIINFDSLRIFSEDYFKYTIKEINDSRIYR